MKRARSDTLRLKAIAKTWNGTAQPNHCFAAPNPKSDPLSSHTAGYTSMYNLLFGEENMKEILRHRDSAKVGHVQSILEAAGISTFMRNEMLSVTEVSIPDFFPAVCVTNDTDYDRAMAVVSNHFMEVDPGDSADRICRHCGEHSPGSFGVCWKCDKPFEV